MAIERIDERFSKRKTDLFERHIDKKTIWYLYFSHPLLRKSFPGYENKIISLENKIILLGNFRRSNYIRFWLLKFQGKIVLYQGLVFFLPIVVLFVPDLGTKNTTIGILILNKLWRRYLTSDEATLLTIQERMFHYCYKTNISSPHSTLFFLIVMLTGSELIGNRFINPCVINATGT